jgi:hypothetical protein
MVRGNCTLEECVKSIRFRRSYASVKECLNDIGRKEWLMIRDFIFTASNTPRRVGEYLKRLKTNQEFIENGRLVSLKQVKTLIPSRGKRTVNVFLQ